MFNRQLNYLVALAQHRHFALAAESCQVTQPALSAGLRELEIAREFVDAGGCVMALKYADNDPGRVEALILRALVRKLLEKGVLSEEDMCSLLRNA
ncbi:LysR family transcriptional regulator [Dyella sp. 2HG41-7]|uniref:LysR family transcriptional regulator n=1 Tax=Dyella sp. 2HG41-7 TaxID=2883239 RepID=UPI0027152818|nr:LysR family transcriptional regulator [Dyella sp. 2HG41-7]